MAIKTRAVTVTTTAASLTALDDDTRGYLDVVRSIAIQNGGSVTVYVGGPDVTSANGYAIVAGSERSFDLVLGDDLWAVAASSTAACKILNTGV